MAKVGEGIKGLGRFVYHATLARNFYDGIASTLMLKPGMGANWQFPGNRGKVFLAKNKGQAEYYGEVLQRRMGDEGEFLAVLRIPVSDLKNVFQDEDTDDDVYSTKPVSLRGAEVFDGSSWRKLSKGVAEEIGERGWDEPEVDPEWLEEYEEERRSSEKVARELVRIAKNLAR